MRGHYTNAFEPLGSTDHEDKMTSIYTTPKFGIGQRCILLETTRGNVLWDCITYLDDETVDFINRKGGLAAIVISHPHYYSTHLEWAERFDCAVYLAREDEEWVCRRDGEGRRRSLGGVSEEVLEGVTAVKTGGHFPGSLVLLWEGKMMIADSFVTTPVRFGFRAACHEGRLTIRVVRVIPCRSVAGHDIVCLHVGGS